MCDGEFRLLLHLKQLSVLVSVCVAMLYMPLRSMRYCVEHEHESQCFGFFAFSSLSRYLATMPGETFNSPFLFRSVEIPFSVKSLMEIVANSPKLCGEVKSESSSFVGRI